MESAPYLEGDSYYTTDDTQSTEVDEERIIKIELKDDNIREQLIKTEEEIVTLRQVLNSKLLLAQDLKRQLGITALGEVKADIINGINSIKDSNTFKATTTAIKHVKEKSSTKLHSVSSNFSLKLDMLRNSNTYKSIEGKVENAYTNVKKEKYTFNPGDKIFAKVKGFVYWPARINPIPADIAIPPNKIPIFFFGTHEVYFISPSSCWPYNEKHKAKWGKPRSRAHFNEGMDEIENNPTLYQYGVDPEAEDFLAQFYEFKRTTEPKSGRFKPLKIEKIKEGTQKADTISPVSVKETKISKNLKTESVKGDVKDMDNDLKVISEDVKSAEEDVKDVKEDFEDINKGNKDTTEDFKDSKDSNEDIMVKKEDSTVVNKDLKKETVNTKDNKCITSNIVVENSVDSLKPTLRSKSVSTSKQTNKRKSTVDMPESKSDEGSDSEKVSSDNPDDEDFEPVKKSARVSRPSVPRAPRVRKSEPKPKRNVKPKTVPKGKKVQKPVVSDVDSLSSISSLEDWQTKDEKRRKEHEESLKVAYQEDLKKEELAIKEASKKARRKNHTRSEGSENNHIDNVSQIKVVETEDRAKSESTLIGKEVIVEISITDIGRSDVGDETSLIDGQTQMNKPELPKVATEIDNATNDTNEKTSDVANVQVVNQDATKHVTIADNNTAVEEPIESVEEKKVEVVEEIEAPKPKKTESTVKSSKVSQSKKSKAPRKERVSAKRDRSSKKRQIQSDESEDEVIDRKAKKSKLTRFVDSDVEIIDNDKSGNVTSPKTAALDAPADATADKMKVLHTYNSDIRSSLVLGHEDYQKCIDRFRSLCTMNIDVITLVSVWQLMDTVKKCRRYKRNESVKTEAQNVYKRFLDIYTNATPDELVKAQAMLAQCRHSHSDNKSIGNGGSQNPTMPSSVDDMFHNKQGTNAPEKKSETTTIINPIPTAAIHPPPVPVETKPRPKEEIDAEKMRLLSADLEAKVSDILNKIEKNAFANPINQKSMSHLLPSSSEQSTVINLPMEWESVDNRSIDNRAKDKINSVSDDDEDDEDDVEAIVKRIEDVPIRQVEAEDSDHDRDVTHHEATSALDARIMNLFNNKFSAAATAVESKSLKKQRPQKYSHSRQPVVVKPVVIETPVEVVTMAMMDHGGEQGPADLPQEVKSADTVIYDLLGV